MLLYCAENTANTWGNFTSYSNVRDACDGGQKRPENTAWKLKQIYIIFFWNITSKYRCGFYRTLFMLLTKAKFTHLFQKRVPYKIHCSFVFRSHTIAYTYTKNVTPGNKTLRSQLNIFQLWKIWLRLRIMQIDKDTLRIKGARQNYLCKLCNL